MDLRTFVLFCVLFLSPLYIYNIYTMYSRQYSAVISVVGFITEEARLVLKIKQNDHIAFHTDIM